jgi:hypothetical protein
VSARLPSRKRLRIVALIVSASTTSACGTTLVVRSIDIPELSDSRCPGAADSSERVECVRRQQVLFDAPGGIVVNSRMSYAVSVVPRPGVDLAVTPDTRVDGVDHTRVLSVNYRRQPLASGELVLTLDAQQTVETIGIDGDPGSVAIVRSLEELAAASREIRKEQQKE